MQELTPSISGAQPAARSKTKTIAKVLVPRRVREIAKQAHRKFVFQRAMRKFLSSPEQAIASDSNLLQQLIYGWGNESWSALDEYLVGCISHAFETEGNILECGSGLSTLLVGAVAKYRGI